METQTQTDMAQALDKLLLRMLTQGVPLTDKNGAAVLDSESKPIMVPPSAAVIREVQRRIERLKIDSPAQDGTPAGALMEEARKNPKIVFEGKTYSPHDVPLDVEEDDAATA